jgi:hypothetical protein
MTTEYTRETTQKNIRTEPNLTMMDPKAEKMASHSAPLDAYASTTPQAEAGQGLDRALRAGKPTGRK